MVIFTQICIAAITIGLLLICIPKSWYTKSDIDFRRGGFWLIGLASSTLTTVWTCYLIYILIVLLINTFKMAGIF